MGSKFEIEDDAFIPEGLEFREEYLNQALAMYRSKKVKVWWRKLYLGSALLTSVLLLSVFLILKPNHRDSNFSSSNNVNSDLSFSEQDGVSKISSESMPKEDFNEGTENNTPILSTTNRNKSEDNFILNNEGKTSPAFGHGGSTSSGVGSPDQKSNYKRIVVPISTRNESASKSLSSNSQTELNIVDGELKGAEVTSSSERNVIIDLPLDVLHTNNGNVSNMTSKFSLFENSERNLAPNFHMQNVHEVKLHPYLFIGAAPWSDFGSTQITLHANPFVGVGVDYSLKKGWSVGTELNYFSISNLSMPYEVKQIKYGLGYSELTTTYYTNKLFYTGIHPVLRKRIAVKHQFELGYSVDFLITGSNTIVTENQSSLESATNNSKQTKGYVGGFCNRNQSVTFGYQYWLGKNKAIGFNYRYGLTDISRNDVFGNSRMNRNSMIGVYFRMNLR